MHTSSSSDDSSEDEDSTFFGGGTTFFSALDFFDAGAATAASKALFPVHRRTTRKTCRTVLKFSEQLRAVFMIIEFF